MEINEITYQGQLPVDAYGPGFFRVKGIVQEGPLALFPSGVTSWGGLEDWVGVIAAVNDFDVIFVGMGADIAPINADIKEQLEEAGVAFEVMATPAACRTYNVLLSEGRRVALVAVPV